MTRVYCAIVLAVLVGGFANMTIANLLRDSVGAMAAAMY